ncbi:Hypothetical predicted protein [Mytilus galloprovincialis]|uniref:B box-type domain-containing protein n=1 Tax=Mytilus galloprovincialis TaxID=29158 RepID=A0A8B6D5X5_MYTGA|nr:Hypothetical predicted protein [Mytilus galloprovincialis]
MASSVKHLCTNCHDKEIANRAVTWCTECEVLFCKNCEKPHSKSRLSKNHKTMSSEDYHKLPAFIQEISSQCKDHKKKMKLYCSFHSCPCCDQCVTNKHKKCKDLKALSDVLKHVKSSASFQLFAKDLKDVKENLDTTIKYMKTRISTINTQKTKAVEEIKYMRKSINDYLNKLEQDILTDLESKHSKLELDMAEVLQQMEQRASQITQMQSQITQMTQLATELQMYIGLREIETTTSRTAKYIEDLETGDYFIEKNLEVNISSALQSILLDVKSFGDIYINTTSSTLQTKAGRKDEAQNIISKVPGIEDIKPSLVTRLTIPKDMKTTIAIFDCCILPDGRSIILDSYKHLLLLFSHDGIFIRKLVTLPSSLRAVCFVRNNTVAVAFGSHSNQTTLMNIEKNKISQTIQLSHACNGVASDGKTLVISSSHFQSTRVNLNDMSHTIIEEMEGELECFSLFQGNMYATICYENKVCCFKSTGELLWTFQHQDIISQFGITLDQNGFVYIASGKNGIEVVSPDGKACKTILSEADGIEGAWAIDINKETGMMIVSSLICDDNINCHTAFVYKI